MDQLTAEEVGRGSRARPISVGLALAAALDDWALTAPPRLAEAGRRHGSDWSLQPVLLIPTPGVIDVRSCGLSPIARASVSRCGSWRRQADPETWPAVSLNLLAGAVAEAGDPDAAVGSAAAGRRGIRETYGSTIVWDSFWKDYIRRRPRRRSGSYSVARALRPETAQELAHALQVSGREDEAVAVFQNLVRLRPDDGRHRACYASLLKERGMGKTAQDEMTEPLPTCKL